MNPWEAGDPLVEGPKAWEAKDPVATTKPWEAQDPVAEAPSWGSVIKSLPAQIGAAAENSVNQLKLISSRSYLAVTPEQGTQVPGPVTTPGGAYMGQRSARDVIRDEQTRAAVEQEFPARQSAAEESSSLVKTVTPPNMSWGQQVVSSVAQSAPPTMVGLAAGILTRNPILAGLIAGGGGGGQQLASTYDEAREKGASHFQAVRAGAIDAVLEGVGEAIPLGFALKEGTPMYKRIFNTMAAEAGQEAATQAMQDMHAYLTYNPDITFKEALYNMSVAAASGAFMGGTIGGAAHIADASQNRDKVPLYGPSGEVLDLQRLQDVVAKDPMYAGTEESMVPLIGDKENQQIRPSTAPNPAVDQLIAQFNAEFSDPSTYTPEAAAEARAALRKYDEALTATPQNPTTVAALAGLNELSAAGDLGELGDSGKVARNAKNYANENDLNERLDRPVLFGPEGAGGEGQALGSVALVPGVYTVGVPTEDRGAPYLRALHDTLSDWSAKYLPGKTLLLMNEGLPTDTGVGWYSQLESGVHVITPATLRSFSSSETFNTNAQAKSFYNLAHEFGHALIVDRFFEGASPKLAAQARREARTGLTSPETIAASPETIQPVLQEFNEIKAQVLDGSMSAQEFQFRWMNPHKQHKFSTTKEHYVPGTAPATQLVDSIIRRAYRNNYSLVGGQLSQLRNEYLGLDEYLAEQTSKYAYAKKWDEKAPATTQSLIGRALQSVRSTLSSFFKQLKQEGWLKPGAKFSEWMDSLTKDAATEAPVKAPKAKVKVKVAKTPVVKEAPKEIETVQHNEAGRDEERTKRARRAVNTLVKDEVITRGDETYKELMGAIDAQLFDEFTDLIQPFLKKKVRFEIDTDLDNVAAFPQPTEEEAYNPSILADAAREWKEKGFRSKYFKAWFGDWENGEGSKVLNAVGEPLVVYHSTAADFDTFAKGDVGFHFGTLRAAHVRGLHQFHEVNTPGPFLDADGAIDNLSRLDTDDPALDTNWSIIPSALNIQNPLDLGFEREAWWHTPQKFGGMLVEKDFVTPDEGMELDAALGDPKFAPTAEDWEPVRALLERKGYDGLRYDNTVETGVSWVAFRPEQIKAVLGTKTFSKSPKIHFELDFDESTPQGHGAAGFFQKLKPLLADAPQLLRSLRSFVGYNALQTQQIAHLNPDLEEVSTFVGWYTQYNTFKARLQAVGERLAHRWTEQLSKEQSGLVGRFLQNEFDSNTHWADLVQENGEWTFKPSATFAEKLKEIGVDINSARGQEIAEFILEIKNSFLTHMQALEASLQQLYANRYGASPEHLQRAVQVVKSDIHEIRKRPFLPRGDYGRYILTVEKKRVGAVGWEVVHREAFQTKFFRDLAEREARAKARSDEQVVGHTLSDTQMVMMQLPSDFIDVAASELGLKSEQVDTLRQVMMPVNSERSLKSYDLKRLKIGGGSRDIPRNYANYIWHSSNMIAKMRYRIYFNLSISGLKSKLRRANYSGSPDRYRIEATVNVLERMKDMIMSPPQELHTLRSFVAVSYLWLNPKTALMNATGLLTTLSAMTSEQGRIKGSAQFLKAAGQAIVSLKLTDLNARSKTKLDPAVSAALDRAIAEGVLSQSYAYYLAGMANANNLHRLPAVNFASQSLRKAVDLGMWAFRLIEMFTRRTTFIGQYQQAKAEGKSDEQAYESAVAATNLLQNDYSVGNMPRILQGFKTNLKPGLGKKLVEGAIPAMTIFASFTQFMAFHAFGGYELGKRRQERYIAEQEGRPVNPRKMARGYTLQIMIILMVLAGYEGLPGAENMLDFLDWLWKKFSNEPLRKKLREFVQTMEQDPVLMSHGLAHNVAGFDVSRSIGLGRIIPGTDQLAHSSAGSFKEDLGGLALTLAGPLGGMTEFALRSISGKGDLARNLARFPGGIGNILTAYQWAEDGVRGPTGDRILRGRDGELRDPTTYEIFGRAAGFNSGDVSRSREIMSAQHDAKMYWSMRRGRLLEQLWTATWKDDREAQADVRDAISKYNDSVPEEHSALLLRPKDIANSMKARRHQQQLSERGLPAQKRYRSLYQDTRESFAVPGEEASLRE